MRIWRADLKPLARERRVYLHSLLPEIVHSDKSHAPYSLWPPITQFCVNGADLAPNIYVLSSSEIRD